MEGGKSYSDESSCVAQICWNIEVKKWKSGNEQRTVKSQMNSESLKQEMYYRQKLFGRLFLRRTNLLKMWVKVKKWKWKVEMDCEKLKWRVKALDGGVLHI